MHTIRDAYTHWSETYDTDRNLTRDLDQQVTRDAVAAYRGAAVLELGCGTGKNTTLLAGLGRRVCALDFSPGMIAQARAKVATGKVQFALADLTQPWPLPASSVDLVVCNLVLEHIRDLDFIFTEARRVLASGGHFFISELHPFRQYQGKKAVFTRGDDPTEITAFVHHISAFLAAAETAGFTLHKLGEWWHEADDGAPPRLVTFLFAD